MEFKISNSTQSLKRLLFLTLIVNYCGSTYFAISNGIFGQAIAYMTLGLSLFHAFLYVYFYKKNKSIVIWIILYLILFFSYRICRRREVLDLFVYASFYGSLNYKEISKVYLKSTAMFFGTVVFLSLVHIIPTAPPFFRGEVYRYTLGFNHPNACGYYSLMIASSLLLIFYNVRKYWISLSLLFLLFITHFLFNNRSSTVCIFLIFLVYSVCYLNKNILNKFLKSRIIKILLILMIPLMVIVLVKISIHSNSFSTLNGLLSSRLENNYLYLKEYSIKFFGDPNVPTWIPVYDGWAVRYLDSGYMQSLLMLGAFNSFVYLSIYLKAILYCVRKKNTAAVVLLIIFSLILIVEASPLRWYFAIPLLFQNNERTFNYAE